MNTCTLDADHLRLCSGGPCTETGVDTTRAGGGGAEWAWVHPRPLLPRTPLHVLLLVSASSSCHDLGKLAAHVRQARVHQSAILHRVHGAMDTVASKFEAGKSGTRKLHCILFSFLLAVFPILMIV